MSNRVLISVAEEVHEHFQRVKDLTEEIIDSDESKDADRISAVRALSSEIKSLSEIQAEVYSQESVANLKEAVVEVLREYDKEIYLKVIQLFEEKNARTV